MTAAGPFEVKLTPQPAGEDAVLGRLTLEKAFHGDLEATSKGLMLAFSSSLVGLAGAMRIDITGGKHSYVFEYTIAGAA